MDEVNKALILPMLKAELRNTKLINGLNAAGAFVEDFNTDLAKEIFQLIGFNDLERDDEPYNFYYNLVDRFTEKNTDDFLDNLHKIATALYEELLLEKARRRKVDERKE